jgi:hypothetical protein
MNEPETKNEETGGERGERVVGVPLRYAVGIDPGDVGAEPAIGIASREDADTAVVGEAVGLDELRGGTRVVMKNRMHGMPPSLPLSYLSILNLDYERS